MQFVKTMFLPDAGTNARVTLRVLLREGIRLGFMAAVLEVLVVWFAPQYRRQIFDDEFTAGFPLAVDASGQRGEVVSQQKSADEYRILVLGDSISFGTGVAADMAWPAQLCRKLAESDVTVQCINAAAPGKGLRENLLDYEAKWQSYQPDLVLIAVSNNMVALSLAQKDLTSESRQGVALSPQSAEKHVGLKTKIKRWSKELASPSWASTQSQRLSYALGLANHHVEPNSPRGPMLAYGYQQADLPPELAETGWALLESDVEKLNTVVNESGAELMAVTFPVRFELSDAWIDNEKWVPKRRLLFDSESLFRETCERSGVRVIESGTAFRSHLASDSHVSTSDWYLHFDFSHFAEAGHDVIATSVAEKLVAQGSLRQN